MQNNLRFGHTPPHVAAETFSEFSSHIPIALQRSGNIWDDVAPVVAKFDKLNFNRLTSVQSKNRRTCVAIPEDFCNDA